MQNVEDVDVQEFRKNLQWVKFPETQVDVEKLKFKRSLGFVIGLGTLTTMGILFTGLYFLKKKNSRMQQLCMRYRVLSQGVTVGMLMFGFLYKDFK